MIDATVEVEDGNLQVYGAASMLLGSLVPYGGPISVTGNTVSVQDADLADPAALGNLLLATTQAAVTVSDNLLVRADGGLTVITQGMFGNNDVCIVGNADVRAGRSDGTNTQLGQIAVLAESLGGPARLAVEGNKITGTAAMALVDIGDGAHISFVGNELSLGTETTDGQVQLSGGPLGSVIVSGNSGELAGGPVTVIGYPDGAVAVSDNEIAFTRAVEALALRGSGTATVTGNTFTSGDATPSGVALHVEASDGTFTVTATENEFVGFWGALSFVGGPAGSTSIDAKVNDNVFDMEFTAAPQVAYLESIGDVIDATNNYWGGITDVATLTSYVTNDADTVAWEGDIQLEPVKATR